MRLEEINLDGTHTIVEASEDNEWGYYLLKVILWQFTMLEEGSITIQDMSLRYDY